MKKLLLTTIALTAIGVAVKAKGKTSDYKLVTIRVAEENRELALYHVVKHLNFFKKEYVGHEVEGDKIHLIYKGNQAR